VSVSAPRWCSAIDVTWLTEYAITSVRVLGVRRLADDFPERDAKVPNSSPRLSHLLKDGYAIIGDIVRKAGHAPVSRAYERAGPRPTLFFNPSRVRAGILTAGGLCPGLNNVIREITRTLINVYEVDKVLGLRNGLWGLHDDKEDDEIELTLDRVSAIGSMGGSILGAGRGGLNPDELPLAVEGIRSRRLDMVFIIGGDGTHRAAEILSKALKDARIVCSVVCVPKTIDNDIDLIDHSFGFGTSVEEAVKSVQTAKVEGMGAPNGIGLVKLMGRNAGFIAAHAVLASGIVDCCLIPEVPIVMQGPKGVLTHLERTVKRKGYAVMVVAEGAGQAICATDPKAETLAAEKSPGELLDTTGAAAPTDSREVDKGGHKELLPIGKWLKTAVQSHFDRQRMEVNIKYIDPSYLIRSVPANANDALYCLLLGQNAAHAAMAGFSDVSVGLCNNRMVLLPVSAIVANSPRVMDPLGRTWERVVSSTGQPNTAVALMHAVTGRTIF
jgi:6-phosphofructokinase 1